MARSYRLGIVGAGPCGTYVLERIVAHLVAEYRRFDLHVSVFDPTGQFGAGAVHSPEQPPTSPLNRIAGQIAFAADESNEAAGALLPQVERPDFVEWCRGEFDRTADARFDMAAENWPLRYLHGLALRARFDRYAQLLSQVPGCRVTLHPVAVNDLEPLDSGVICAHLDDGEVQMLDYVVLATGHTSSVPPADSAYDRLARAATGRFHYAYSAYPLDQALSPVLSGGRDLTVGMRGLGLTSFDIMLLLTEGLGGRFVRGGDGQLTYESSGREPSLVAFSRGGIFTGVRPHNAKEPDLQRYEHRGVFFTETSIDRLRHTHGVAIHVAGVGIRCQLDFERHVLPLMLLEMRLVYYATLLGGSAARAITKAAQQPCAAFVDQRLECHQSTVAATAFLCAAVDAIADRALDSVASVLADRPAPAAPDAMAIEAAMSYVDTVFGEEVASRCGARLEQGEPIGEWLAAQPTVWRHHRDPRAHLFDFDRLVKPIGGDSILSGELYTDAVLAHLRWDLAQAAQDNIRNPTKAACDGVWRDLRNVLGYAVEHAGLTAASHRQFVERYLPVHNRLCNGASIEVMERVAALITSGLLDITPGAGATPTIVGDELFVEGPHTGVRRRLDLLVEAWVHPFDVNHQALSLYGNLLRRGLIRAWLNPALDGCGYQPGGVDVTADNQPIRADGTVWAGAAIIGAPTEGRVFYPIGAARPRQNHHVLNDAIRCYDAWIRSVSPSYFERRVTKRSPVHIGSAQA